MGRTVSRILDHLAHLQGHRPLGLKHTSMLLYSRAGRLANAIRSCLLHYRNSGIADTEWGDPAHWLHLPANCPASPQQCADATAASLVRSRADWTLECDLFGVHHLPVVENWSVAAWEDPQDPSNLDSRQQVLPNADLALFSDGPMRKPPWLRARRELSRVLAIGARHWQQAHNLLGILGDTLASTLCSRLFQH